MKYLFLISFCSIILGQESFFPSSRLFKNERLHQYEVLGKTPNLLSEVRPFSKNQFKINRYLSDDLSDLNWKRNNEFDFYPRSLNRSDSLIHFISWVNEANTFFAEINMYSEILNIKKTALSGAVEYRLFGSIANQFHFSFLNRQNSFLSNKELAIQHSNLTNNSSFENMSISRTDINSSDYNEGYLIYELNSSNYFFFGKIPWDVGFGQSGKFIINGDQIKPLTSFGLNLNFWKLNYIAMHGSLLASELISQNTDSIINNNYSNIPEKYLVVHRFEFNPTKNLQFHYSEMIVYGNRGIDLTYANPFSFLRPQEHEQIDRDNALITLGVKYRYPELNILTYHDFILDEWKISEVASYFNGNEHWFGNKQGMLNGITWANENFQFWIEHVSIAPYVYSHKYAVNRYTHDSKPIGFKSGPNSRQYFLQGRYFINQSIMITSSIRFSEKGMNYDPNLTSDWNIGGDIFYGDNTRFKETRKFLEGIKHNNNTYKINIKYEPNYYYALYFDFESDDDIGNKINIFFRMSL